MKNRASIIPHQEKGKKYDYSKTSKSNSEDERRFLYESSCKRLFDINNWHELCGIASAYFCLTDRFGKEKHEGPVTGDHIRIGIPAPRSIDGDGYDWVKIEDLMLSEYSGANEMSYILVHPSENPFKRNGVTAHFFTSHASSTFIVQHDNQSVTSSYHGRNEIPNIKESKGFIDKLRHLVVALTAIAGFSKLQWKLLINNIVGS